MFDYSKDIYFLRFCPILCHQILKTKKPPVGGHKKRVIVFINRLVIYVLGVYA